MVQRLTSLFCLFIFFLYEKDQVVPKSIFKISSSYDVYYFLKKIEVLVLLCPGVKRYEKVS